jgi:hypothetical protein
MQLSKGEEWWSVTAVKDGAIICKYSVNRLIRLTAQPLSKTKESPNFGGLGYNGPEGLNLGMNDCDGTKSDYGELAKVRFSRQLGSR